MQTFWLAVDRAVHALADHATAVSVLFVLSILGCTLSMGLFPTMEVIAPATFIAVFLTCCLAWIVIRLANERQAHNDQDALTGARSRKAVLEKDLKMLLRQWWRHGSRFAVIAIDVNMFKKINSIFGYPVGDWVLQQVVKELRKLCRRRGDIICRRAGDEFLIIIRIEREEEAYGLAERVRTEFKLALDFLQQDEGSPRTYSIRGDELWVTIGLDEARQHGISDDKLRVTLTVKEARKHKIPVGKLASLSVEEATEHGIPDDELRVTLKVKEARKCGIPGDEFKVTLSVGVVFPEPQAKPGGVGRDAFIPETAEEILGRAGAAEGDDKRRCRAEGLSTVRPELMDGQRDGNRLQQPVRAEE